MKQRQHGFSLIELLIVVTIILIIVAMAVPSLNSARIRANEASAANSLRQIHNAEVTFMNAYPDTGFSNDLASLGGTPAQCAAPSATSACLLDSNLANNGTPAGSGKSGYVFAMTPVQTGTINTAYTAGAAPLSYNTTGVKNFCITSDGVIRRDAGAAASTPVTTTGLCVAMSPL